MEPEKTEIYLTVAQAAKELQVYPDTVYDMDQFRSASSHKAGTTTDTYPAYSAGRMDEKAGSVGGQTVLPPVTRTPQSPVHGLTFTNPA